MSNVYEARAGELVRFDDGKAFTISGKPSDVCGEFEGETFRRVSHTIVPTPRGPVRLFGNDRGRMLAVLNPAIPSGKLRGEVLREYSIENLGALPRQSDSPESFYMLYSGLRVPLRPGTEFVVRRDFSGARPWFYRGRETWCVAEYALCEDGKAVFLLGDAEGALCAVRGVPNFLTDEITGDSIGEWKIADLVADQYAGAVLDIKRAIDAKRMLRTADAPSYAVLGYFESNRESIARAIRNANNNADFVEFDIGFSIVDAALSKVRSDVRSWTGLDVDLANRASTTFLILSL